MADEEEVRVLRIIEYRGPRSWVEKTLLRSIHGTKVVEDDKKITAVTLHEYPEVLYSNSRELPPLGGIHG